ncbi:HIT-like protein [Gloeophyllum trabeum ATCC 11539]|uniref:HIT-like protein n=1 Tax=Gloeophyllum trabeum (strain ATCC 11539 / FP-39264 / Madison 617) TaxID=670483 RepID=S7QEE2_GLOTA|nr:HIT-like protein [Gloeophyllum trabeum ATCC 11539]EPQ58176.1 HIT-like protein [Gloeophyllum trabeum ATCC 11539]
MPNLTILRTYALKSSPTELPSSVLFQHTERSLTIFDAYPKAMFHFLVLPRVTPPFTVAELSNLKALFKSGRERAKSLIEMLGQDARQIQKMVEEEMVKRYGSKWDVWLGFHAVPSMEHLHLHVISSDLVSQALKNKKHYNSFHPKLGFFLHLNDVLSWFESDQSYYDMKTQLKKEEYEPLLKQDLVCWECDRPMKNIPTLKGHLKEKWEERMKKEKSRFDKKRKRAIDPEEAAGIEQPSSEPSNKRADTGDTL